MKQRETVDKYSLCASKESPAALPDTFVEHLGAEHLLLIQTDGAKGAEIPLSIWA